MIHILVTGAHGQLGCELRHLSTSFPFHFTFADSKVLDITKPDKIDAFFSQERFQFCINTAAYTAVDASETDKLKAYETNVGGVQLLAKACHKHKVPLIHISTDFVFDGMQAKAYTEGSTPAPLNVYGMSKLQSENEAISIQPHSIIIRTSWLYSSFGNNFVKKMLELSQKNKVLRVVNDQIGSPTYARDLAECILQIIGQIDEGYVEQPWGVYHYSNEGVASWYDFAQAIFEYAKRPIQVDPIPSEAFPSPAKRPHFSVLNKQKIRETFGLRIPYWRESLKECLRLLA